MQYIKLSNNQYREFLDSSLGLKFRVGQRDHFYVIDAELVVGGFLLAENTGQDAHNTNIHHNTLIYRGTQTTPLIQVNEVDSLTGFTSDYNTFYSTQANICRVGLTDYTFAQWQALGYDLNSTLLAVPPAFDDSEL